MQQTSMEMGVDSADRVPENYCLLSERLLSGPGLGVHYQVGRKPWMCLT